MSELIDPVEQQLASLWRASAPATLREAVLQDLGAQLRAQHWERRLLQVAVGMFVVGVALNASVSWFAGSGFQGHQVAVYEPESIKQIAAAVAEATDAETGARFARQLALRCGEVWSEKQQTEFQGQLQSRVGPALTKKDG
jgi:hypothetical protein